MFIYLITFFFSCIQHSKVQCYILLLCIVFVVSLDKYGYTFHMEIIFGMKSYWMNMNIYIIFVYVYPYQFLITDYLLCINVWKYVICNNKKVEKDIWIWEGYTYFSVFLIMTSAFMSFNWNLFVYGPAVSVWLRVNNVLDLNDYKMTDILE